MSKRFMMLIAVILVGLAIAGCGGGGPEEVTVSMRDFAFEPTGVSVSAGAEVNLTLNNRGALDHNFVIMNQGSEVEGSWSDTDASNAYFQHNQTPAGEEVTVTFTAPSEPGEYQFLCSVPAHLEQGMEGILTVTQ